MVEPIGFRAHRVDADFDGFRAFADGGKLYVATAKGQGNRTEQLSAAPRRIERPALPGAATPTSPRCSTARLRRSTSRDREAILPHWTADRACFEPHEGRAGTDRLCRRQRRIRIKHVIYIIKENRTYDQILGDLKQDGKPVGNGDPSLTMYGEAITPNEHKLALQFGVLDNFFDSGEVSGDGHVWSTAAIGTDYLEKTWQQAYRGDQRTYDFEGVVADGYPLLQKIPDVNEPASGYLWGNLAAHGKTYYHFGEFISSTFCDEEAVADPRAWARCWPGPIAHGRRSRRARRCPRSGAAA